MNSICYENKELKLFLKVLILYVVKIKIKNKFKKYIYKMNSTFVMISILMKTSMKDV